MISAAQIKEIVSAVVPLTKAQGDTRKKATVADTFHIGKLSGNRLNSGTIRSQLIFCADKDVWNGSDESAKQAIHADQCVFVQVGDDEWDVYRGVDDSEGHSPVVWKRVKGLADFLKEKKNLELEIGSPCRESVAENGSGLLRVGDRFVGKGEGEYTVVEVCDKAYRIKAELTGKIRTVPKTVVSAWYAFYREHDTIDYDVKSAGGTVTHKTGVPIREAATRPVRDALNQTTEDDSYEHGYDGMLGSIARWLLDHPREEQPELPMEQSPVPVPPVHVDILTTALKLFEERRDGEEWDSPEGKKEWGYYAVNKGAREYFDELRKILLALPEGGLLTREKIDELFLGKKENGNVVFKPMWSGSNGTGWNKIKKGLDAEGGVKDVSDWLLKYAKTAGDVVSFATEEDDKGRPPGFGKSVESELLMKFHPDAAIKCGTMTIDVLQKLQLMQFEKPSDYTPTEYTRVMGIAADIKQRMDAMGITQMLENDEEADYITVNEFLAWFHENEQEISKECEVKKMKTADYSTSTNPPPAKKPQVDVSNAEQVVLLRLAAALRAKPFAILAGHSGTGKSRMVRQLAYMTAAAHNHKALFEDEHGKRLKSPGNFCMVQVKPNWHDSTDLLGYYSELSGGFKGTEFVKFICKAYAYPDVPFFVCLDEMNLAPVEQYFAEYLSAIESRKIDSVTILDGKKAEKTISGIITDQLLSNEAWKKGNKGQDYSGIGCELEQSMHWLDKYGLTIPRNLFVVGTVNMDESTNQFSRKVLDRAFTLEMTDANFKDFGKKDPEPTFDDFAGDAFADALLTGDVIAKKPAEGTLEKAVFDKQIGNLEKLKPILEGTSFVVAYRFANEYMLYENALAEMEKVIDVGTKAPAESGVAKTKPEAFDDMILMKVLPRITGDTEVVMHIFVGETPDGKEQVELGDPSAKGLVEIVGKKSASFTKMDEIVKRGKSSGSGTLTFWP